MLDRPVLRGWIHAVATPCSLAATTILACRATTAPAVAATVVFAVCSVELFGVSAVYHLGSWSARVRAVLGRVDHADILFLIAGTYTPLSVLVLRGGERIAVLSVVWVAAVLGALSLIAWAGLPRSARVAAYVVLGWVAIPVLPELLRSAGPATLLVAAGGGLYTLGALVYGRRRPDPWPRVFGFHEVFHCLTVAAFACQFIAVWLVVRGTG